MTVCETCGGTTRVACPGMSVEPKTQMGRDAAGLVAGKDYCYGMHMGHPCHDCTDIDPTPTANSAARTEWWAS